ncbi:MAG: S9 family peptidase [Acidobacteriota bacterium]
MRRDLLLLLTMLSSSIPALASDAFTPADLLKLKRIGDFAVSPDGRQIVVEVALADLLKNTRVQHLYAISASGGDPRQLTNGPTSEEAPCWGPDGKRISFSSTRDGTSQIWQIDASGGEAHRLTSISTGASQPLFSPDGKWIAFLSEVYPDLKTDAEQKARIEAEEKDPLRPRQIDHLMYRHGSSWSNGRRRHIMIMPAAGGDVRDLTPGDVDSPSRALRGRQFAFSPDSREICFARNDAADTAASTNDDLYTVDLASGTSNRITSNPASDSTPAYSPDGRSIAYVAQRRPGNEADRFELMLYDRRSKISTPAVPGFDRWIREFQIAPDGKTVYFATEDAGRRPLFAAPIGGKPKKLVDGGSITAVAVRAGEVFFRIESLCEPPEICAYSTGRKAVRRVTNMNTGVVQAFRLSPGESVTYPGSGGTGIQAWVVKPASFTPDKRYPMVVLIHGGPEGAWSDAFNWRWNAQIFANAGLVVMMPNPRGSTGFGQSLVDEINRDWGGKAYVDIMAGVEFMAKRSYVDPERIAAAGGSFGGYMVNWIAGRTDRFKALVSHAGIYSVPSFYGTTDELWFPEWEFGGAPWEKPDEYESWSPHNGAINIRTPMLLTHGEKDYRVSITEAQQLFAALQRRGVPSRLLWFPDEGHAIEKPKNQLLWLDTIISWLRKYLVES